jgi:hypothetical protein
LYSRVQRDFVYINRLTDFIRRKYQIEPVMIKPAKRGYFGETWRLDGVDGSYFVKLNYSNTHKSIYENSFHIVQHLSDYGIDFISKIIKTADGGLSSRFDTAVLGIFEWVDGENVQNEHTKIPEYQMLAKVYTVPPYGLLIPTEKFSCKNADLFYNQWERLKSSPADKTAMQISELFEKNRTKITHRARRLELFSQRCVGDISHFYITHGDAGGNIIVNGKKFTIIDWDDPVYAPPERDAWFCLHWDWAMDAFHKALQQNAIEYTMCPNRLAYYCYNSFFLYMTEELGTYFDIGNRSGDMYQKLTDYMSCWIEDELRFADTIL